MPSFGLVLHHAARCINGREMSSKNRLTINLSRDEHEQVAAMADENHVSAAWIGRQALREFLERCRRQQKRRVIPSLSPSGEGGTGSHDPKARL